MKLPRLEGLLAVAAILCAQGAAAGPAGQTDDGPVLARAASRELPLAWSLFDAGRWAEAAPVLERVARGETGDPDGSRQVARFYLGVALHRLRLYDASLRVFAVIADAPGHYGFQKTLEWLAALDVVLPEPAGTADHVGRYLREAPGPARADLHARIQRLLGTHAYRARSYEVAVEAFEQIERESAFYARAQFMIGMSYMQLRKSVRAIKAFGRVVEAVGEETEGAEAKHLRNLAWISMARVHFSASAHLDESNVPTVDMNKLDASAKYWGRVEPDSELWPDAQLESSWFYFWAGHYPRALGNLHDFASGYLSPSLFPEADVIRGMVALTVCQYDDVWTIVGRMRQRYLPIRRELEALLGRLAGHDEDVVAFYRHVRARRAAVPAILRPIVDTAIADRPIRKHLDYLAFVDAEEARLAAMPPSFRSSTLGGEVETGLALARAVGTHGVAARVRELYQRRLDDLDAHLLDGQKLVTDAIAGRAAERRDQAAAPYETSYAPKPDVEHEIWPFDGESWRDEIGSYRQTVVARCPR